MEKGYCFKSEWQSFRFKKQNLHIMFQAWVVVYLFLLFFICFCFVVFTCYYYCTGSIVIWLKNIIIIPHLVFWKVELVSSFLRVFTPAHCWNSCNKSCPRRNSFLPMLNKDLPRQILSKTDHVSHVSHESYWFLKRPCVLTK